MKLYDGLTQNLRFSIGDLLKLKLTGIAFLLFTFCSLAQNNWLGTVDSDWDTPGNWSFGTVPTIAEDVTIPSFAYVNVNVAATANSITIFNSATVDVNGSITFNTDLTVFLDATLNWNAGTLSGASINNNGTVILSTGSAKTLNSGVVFLNSNSVIFDTAGVTLNISNGSIFDNTSIGTLDIKSSTSTGIYKSGTGGSLINSGTIIKSDGTSFNISADFSSLLGEIDVQVGILNLTSPNNMLSEVELNTSLGGVLNLSGTFEIFGFWTGTNLGELNFIGNFNVPIAVTFNFFNNGIYHKSGTVNGPGTIVNNGNYSFLTSSSKVFNSELQFNNFGAFVMETGAITMNLSNSSVLTNKSGALFHIKASTTTGIYQTGTGGTFINEGEILKTDGTAFNISCLFENYNYLNVQSDILNLNGAAGSRLINGTYDVASGAIIELNTTHEGQGTWNGNILGAFELRSLLNVFTSLTNNLSGNGIHWYTGTIQGGGILTNETEMDLLTSSAKTLNSATTILNNNYIMFENGGITFNLSNGSVFNNSTSGTVEIQATTATGIYQTGTGGTFNNEGTLLKTVGDNYSISAYFNNTGLIDIQSGKLTLNGSPTHDLTGGVYNIAPLTELELNGSVRVDGDINGTIDGDFNWRATVLIENTTSNFTTGNGINWLNGTIQGGGLLNNHSNFSMKTTSLKTLNFGTTIENYSVFLMDEAGVILNISNSSILRNMSIGTVNLHNTTATGIYQTGSGGLFENHGLINKDIGAGLSISAQFINDGTMHIQQGELELNGSTTHELNGGIYQVELPGILELNGSNQLSGILTGYSLGEFNLKSNITIPIAADLDISDNGVNWITGTIQGSGILTNNNRMNINTSSGKSINSATGLMNNGDLIMDSSGITINMVNGSYIQNEPGGYLEINSNSTTGIYQTGTGGSVINNGILRKSTSSVYSISCTVENNGVIAVQEGELRFSSSGSMTNGINSIVKGIGEFSVPVAANYVSQGTFQPGGSVGTLLFDGDYESEATSVMEFELDGLTPDTEHDVLEIEGNAAFDGDLIVHLGFIPAVGDQFVVATVSGTITSCTLPTSVTAYYLNSFYTFDVICNTNDITLERSCILPVGCTNDWACNYDPLAMCEDASCILLDGDADHSGAVDILDLIAVSSNFGCSSNCPVGDANYDLEVNILDLVTVSSNFGATCP